MRLFDANLFILFCLFHTSQMDIQQNDRWDFERRAGTQRAAGRLSTLKLHQHRPATLTSGVQLSRAAQVSHSRPQFTAPV